MRKNWIPSVLILGLIPFSTHAFAQTSVALSGYGTFSGTTSGNGTAVSPANQAGGIIEVRHISNALLGFEATYSFNRANQTYTSPAVAYPQGACPVSDCSTSKETVRGNAHEITLDWVPSIGIGSLRPFGVLGVGALLDVPSQSEVTVTSIGSCPAGVCTGPGVATNTSSTSTSAQAVYVYGAGLDWGLLPHLGLRLQYRGNLYQTPNLTNLFSSANAFTHTAEPMIGAYFNF